MEALLRPNISVERLSGRYREERRPFSAVALHSEPSALTAILNDYGPEEVFARQVWAHGRPGDVLILMSTSGRSRNVDRRRRTRPERWAADLGDDRPCAEPAGSFVSRGAGHRQCLYCNRPGDALGRPAPAVRSDGSSSPCARRSDRPKSKRHVHRCRLEFFDDGPASWCSGTSCSTSIGSAQLNGLSPEAPVPVLHDLRDHRRPGGAALAALLAARCGDRPVTLIAPFADDAAAQQIWVCWPDGWRSIPLPWTGSTPVKTRIRVGRSPGRPVGRGRKTRIDHLDPRRARFPSLIPPRRCWSQTTAVTPPPTLGCAVLIASCTGRIPVVWDPHPRGTDPVRAASWSRPTNPSSDDLIAGRPTSPGSAESRGTIAEMRDQARHLARQWQVGGDLRDPRILAAPSSASATTRRSWCQGTPVGGGDTCGAGDSLAAAATCALADGALAQRSGDPRRAPRRRVRGCRRRGRSPARGRAVGMRSRTGSVADLVDSVRRAGGVGRRHRWLFRPAARRSHRHAGIGSERSVTRSSYA